MSKSPTRTGWAEVPNHSHPRHQHTYKHLEFGSDAAKAAELVHSALELLTGGELPEGMLDTPERFVRYLLEFMSGKPEEVLGELFMHKRQDGIHGMVTQARIPYRMICEHHLLPAMGHAAIGYIPNGKVVGLSKLARLVDAVGTRKPSLQELMCEEIADALDTHAEARGVIVVLQAEHSCMACRGVNTPHVVTSSSCVRGVFRDVQSAREEFFHLIHHNGYGRS